MCKMSKWFIKVYDYELLDQESKSTAIFEKFIRADTIIALEDVKERKTKAMYFDNKNPSEDDISIVFDLVEDDFLTVIDTNQGETFFSRRPLQNLLGGLENIKDDEDDEDNQFKYLDI